MPQVIGLVIVEAAIAATGATVSATAVTAAATIVGSVIAIGASVGVQFALRQGEEDQPLDRPELTIREALPPRFIVFGRQKIGGAVIFEEKSNNVGTPLLRMKAICCAPINGVERLWFNGNGEFLSAPLANQVTVGVISDTFAGNVFVEVGFGLFTQNASPMLSIVTDIGWTAAYRNQGIAYIVTRANQGSDPTDHARRFPQGAPDVDALVVGVGLPDPRLGHDPANEATWTYSDNAALALYRFLVERDGWQHVAADYDTASFIQAANDCDDVMSNGEKRYRAWGVYWTTDSRKETLDKLLAACDGRLIEQPDGRAKLFVGKFVAPVVTIDDSQILMASMQRFGEPTSRVDKVKPRIRLETNDWQESEVGEVLHPGADTTSAPRVLDLVLDYCPSPSQALRLANAARWQRNPEFTGTIRTTLAGLAVYGERFVRVILSELGIDRTFEILAFGLNIADMTVTITVQSVEPTAWDTP